MSKGFYMVLKSTGTEKGSLPSGHAMRGARYSGASVRQRKEWHGVR